MLRFLAFAAAGVALLGLFLAWPAPEPAAQPRVGTAARAQEIPARESRALSERVAHLERELERLSAQLDRLATADAREPRVADVRPLDTEPSEVAPLVGVAPLSDALELEDNDDLWERDIADYFMSRLADPRWSQSGLLEIDCRTTLCRLQLEHESADEAASFIAGLALADLEVGSYTAEQAASGGRSVSTLVLLRRGAALPTSY